MVVPIAIATMVTARETAPVGFTTMMKTIASARPVLEWLVVYPTRSVRASKAGWVKGPFGSASSRRDSRLDRGSRRVPPARRSTTSAATEVITHPSLQWNSWESRCRSHAPRPNKGHDQEREQRLQALWGPSEGADLCHGGGAGDAPLRGVEHAGDPEGDEDDRDVEEEHDTYQAHADSFRTGRRRRVGLARGRGR